MGVDHITVRCFLYAFSFYTLSFVRCVRFMLFSPAYALICSRNNHFCNSLSVAFFSTTHVALCGLLFQLGGRHHTAFHTRWQSDKHRTIWVDFVETLLSWFISVD